MKLVESQLQSHAWFLFAHHLSHRCNNQHFLICNLRRLLSTTAKRGMNKNREKRCEKISLRMFKFYVDFTEMASYGCEPCVPIQCPSECLRCVRAFDGFPISQIHAVIDGIGISLFLWECRKITFMCKFLLSLSLAIRAKTQFNNVPRLLFVRSCLLCVPKTIQTTSWFTNRTHFKLDI